MVRRFVSLGLVLAFCALPAVASAQFGGLVKKKSKFDTKPVKKLIKEIDGVLGEYEDATARVWSATETVQNLVKQYSGGEFPALTRPWKEIRTAIDEAKKDAERAALVEWTDQYFKEMDARKKSVEAFLADPAKAADLKGKLQPPEVKQLTTVASDLKPVPEKDTELIRRSKDLSEKAAKAVAKLGKQIKKDPLKANDYKKLMDKLNAGVEEMGKMPAELQKQIDAINVMMANINKLVTQ